MLNHARLGIQRLEGDARRRGLGLADAIDGVHDLALQVRLVHDVVVDEADGADAGCREVERHRRAQAAGPDEQDLRVEQPALSLGADLRDERLPRVAPRLGAGPSSACIPVRWAVAWLPPKQLLKVPVLTCRS